MHELYVLMGRLKSQRAKDKRKGFYLLKETVSEKSAL